MWLWNNSNPGMYCTNCDENIGHMESFYIEEYELEEGHGKYSDNWSWEEGNTIKCFRCVN